MSEPFAVLLSELPRALRAETDETRQIFADLLQQMADMVAQVEFGASDPTTGSAGGAAVPLTLVAEDANDVRMRFAENRLRRVRVVYAAASTATGVTITNEDGESITAELETIDVKFRKGLGQLTVKATGAGTVVLTLVDVDSAGVTVTDTHTITFS